MFYLGIDGGGTKTSFMLINKLGDILSTLTSSTCHIHQVGFDGFKTVLEKGINEVCSNANITKDDLSYVYFGIPAYGENYEEKIKMNKILQQIIKKDIFSCGNDIEVALSGSLAGDPGICIILGTGAIAAGINEKSQIVRTSGWGHICGDEGSAYWIAKKGIEIFGKESDNRLDKTPLYYIFKEQLQIKIDFDLIFLIKDKYKEDRAKIAKLALLVYNAAKQGDKYAINIFDQAAYECFLMIKGIIKQIHFDNTINISYSGSVFNSNDLIINPLKEYLSKEFKNVTLMPPILSPLKGAAFNALKIHCGSVEKNIIDKLSYYPKDIFI